ncbi:MAG: LysR family transcriptional regulator, partial [Thermaurantiacus tibetensis]
MSRPPDWSLYRSFLAVIETGSLSAAARALGLTQPTLARHVDALEAEIGAADRAVASLISDDRGVRHLLSVPGLGLATAAALCAVIGDVRRF